MTDFPDHVPSVDGIGSIVAPKAHFDKASLLFFRAGGALVNVRMRTAWRHGHRAPGADCGPQ
jgi:hypothetical protein